MLCYRRCDLEHFSLAPHRFINFMRRNDNTTINPGRVQSFTPKNPFPVGGSLAISQASLLPGGRFLLTSTRWVGICLWDLGYNASRPARADAVAFYPFLLDGHLGDPLPTPDGKGILLICDMIISDTQRQLEVLEIYPHHDIPQFTLLASLLTGDVDPWGRDSHYCALHESHLVIFGTIEGSGLNPQLDMMNVWNFRDNTGCKWTTPPSNSFTPSGSALVLFSGSQLLVYNLPDMQPLLGGSWIVETTTNEPKLVIKPRTPTIGNSFPLQAISWINPSSYFGVIDDGWPEGAQDSPHLPSGPLQVEVYLTKAVPAGIPLDKTLPLKIPVYQGACANFMGPTAVGRVPRYPTLMSMWCGQEHLIWRATPVSDPSGRIAFIAIPLPPSTCSQSVDMKALTVFYKPPCRPDPDFVWICPSSGRVVTVVGGAFGLPLDGSAPQVEIQVADYLPPPSCF
ncbi:hypothetical protein BKA70DRAFT_9599 [Coprinopsis sp. MPI-PUGE-AT-0042]|nr:hypothetical protein BKA70DRAFT_9599 [Coprinopsis sp. MPI-PUGE-AT-0042]